MARRRGKARLLLLVAVHRLLQGLAVWLLLAIHSGAVLLHGLAVRLLVVRGHALSLAVGVLLLQH